MKKKVYSLHWRISNSATLLILTQNGFYEFRDPLMKEIRRINAVLIDPSDFLKTMAFQLELVKTILVDSSSDIEDEPIVVFSEIFELLKTLIYSQMPRWDDFLFVTYAMGKKSFNCLEFVLDKDVSFFNEMKKAMMRYLDEERIQLEKK